MRCLGYVRVSTREQDELLQIESIKQFCQRAGLELEGFCLDKGESGAVPFLERPGAQQLLERISRDRLESIVVFDLSRLGRSMLDALNTIHKLESRGVKVLSVKEEFMNYMDPSIRQLVLAILTWFAEMERRRIRERQQAAWAAGKQKGRPRKLHDELLIKYLKRYPGLSLAAVAKVLRGDGFNVSYSTVRRVAERLRRQGILKRYAVAV